MNSQAKPSLKTNLEAVRFNKEVEIPKDKDYLTHLNDLVRALNSSIHFYRAANQDVPNVLLAGVFNEIAESHRMCEIGRAHV